MLQQEVLLNTKGRYCTMFINLDIIKKVLTLGLNPAAIS